jgi:hypothetical protein
MTEDEKAEFEILSLMTPDTHKFAIGILPFPAHIQFALERLQLRDWIRLIDISPVSATEKPILCRIFRAMPEAIAWHELHKNAKSGEHDS